MRDLVVQKVTLNDPPAALAEQAVTRLEVARWLLDFSSARAVARLTQTEQTVPWPEPRPATPQMGAPSSPEVERSVTLLVERQLLAEAAYWLKNATENGNCDGARVAELLAKAVNARRPGTPKEKVFAAAVELGFCSSTEYWVKHAVPGGQCGGKYVVVILRNIAAKTAAD